MTKEDCRTEAKELEKTLMTEGQIWQGFIAKCCRFLPQCQAAMRFQSHLRSHPWRNRFSESRARLPQATKGVENDHLRQNAKGSWIFRTVFSRPCNIFPDFPATSNNFPFDGVSTSSRKELKQCQRSITMRSNSMNLSVKKSRF